MDMRPKWKVVKENEKGYNITLLEPFRLLQYKLRNNV